MTSRSNVETGAPSRMAATPPTRMNSTPCWSRILRMSKNLSAASIPDDLDAVDESLGHFEPLRRRQAEHPENQAVILLFRWKIRQESHRKIFIGRMLGKFHREIVYPISMISPISARRNGSSSGSQAWTPGLA